MAELKQDIAQRISLSLFKIEPFHQSILPTTELDQSPANESDDEPEGTIYWETPLNGVIVGKKGAKRNFYLCNDEIFIMLSPDFTAGENKHPNVRHQQIRDAINVGRAFNAKAFKDSPDFAQNTEDCGSGRIVQGADGRWWAWKQGGITGHPFFQRQHALEYLDRVETQAQKQLICRN